MEISTATLAKISQTCSGQAMKIAIDHVTPQGISLLLSSQNLEHRIEDASSATVFDDKLPTVVSGMENLSQTALTCFLSQMDSLRFRNILIFPTKLWFKADECELTFWDRLDLVMQQKLRSRLQHIKLEDF